MQRSLSAVLFALVLSAGCPATATDLATDDGVRAAYKKATGDELNAEHGCIGRTGVRDVIVVGDFAYDRGCIMSGGFVGGAWLDTATLTATGPSKLGWATMDSKARADFALRWAEKVLFHWDGSFVPADNKAFTFEDTPAYTAPAAVAKGDGVVVTFWIEEPPGMQDRDVFDQIELTFDAKGAVTRASKAGFAVDGARLR